MFFLGWCHIMIPVCRGPNFQTHPWMMVVKSFCQFLNNRFLHEMCSNGPSSNWSKMIISEIPGKHSTSKMLVGRLLSYWEGNFSGAMLNFGRARTDKNCLENLGICTIFLGNWIAGFRVKLMEINVATAVFKPSVPFFRQLWLVLGVKLMEINSNGCFQT